MPKMKTRNKNLFQTLDDILGTRAELAWKLKPIYSMFSEKNDNDDLETSDNRGKVGSKNLEEIAAIASYTAHKFQYSYTTQSFRSKVDKKPNESQNLSLS